MSETTPKLFASKKRAVVIAPAGYGKTHLIAQAVGCQNIGRQLVLTHTHAGVRSLLDMFKRLEVPSALYSVETISGFALKYAASFPHSSGLSTSMPVAKEWNEVIEPATQIIRSSSGKRILLSSYTGMYVDEYQDCTLVQHELIKALAEILPCRIVGDPLQGVFDFEESPMATLTDDVLPFYERLPDLSIPWRWEKGNKSLGVWLSTVRGCFLKGDPINLGNVPTGVEYYPVSQALQIKTCYRSLSKNGSVVAIRQMANQAHYTARFLKGSFNSMDEVEGKDLMKWAETLGQSSGRDRALALIDFCCVCLTNIRTATKVIQARVEKGMGRVDEGITKCRDVALSLNEVLGSDEIAMCLKVFANIEKLTDCHLYRYELWNDMQRTIREYLTGRYSTLQDAAWQVRDRGRILGRRVSRRTISRTLLVKGLGFEHAIVLNADELNTKELYVAMTRGSESLTILSSSSIIQREIPNI